MQSVASIRKCAKTNKSPRMWNVKANKMRENYGNPQNARDYTLWIAVEWNRIGRNVITARMDIEK